MDIIEEGKYVKAVESIKDYYFIHVEKVEDMVIKVELYLVLELEGPLVVDTRVLHDSKRPHSTHERTSEIKLENELYFVVQNFNSNATVMDIINLKFEGLYVID